MNPESNEMFVEKTSQYDKFKFYQLKNIGKFMLSKVFSVEGKFFHRI